jgi:hypothetical protein
MGGSSESQRYCVRSWLITEEMNQSASPSFTRVYVLVFRCLSMLVPAPAPPPV